MHNWKNLLKLLASVTAVQIIGFILLPFFSRLYSRADYGILGMLMSFVGLLSPIASLRYDQATLVAKSGHKLKLLRGLGISMCIITSSLLALICTIASPYLTHSKYSAMVPYIYIIPWTVFSSGLFSVLAAHANVEGRYGHISIASLSQGYVNNALKVICGWFKMGVWGFAVAFNSGMMIATTILGLKHSKADYLKGISYHRLKVVAHHYRSFPQYTSWMVMTAMLITNILAMLLPNFYPVEEIGLITMLYMITRRPVQVYADTTSRIYARRLVEIQAPHKTFREDMKKVVLRLFCLAIFSFLLCPYIARPLISLVLGEQWVSLSTIIPWLIPFLFMEATNYIFNFIPDVLRKQKEYLFIQILRLISQVTFICLVAPRLPFETFICYYFIYSACEYALINLWFYRLLGSRSRNESPQ